MIGYAFCGSFCTLRDSLLSLEVLSKSGEEIQPIMSPITYSSDTRFITSEELKSRVRTLTGREIIHTIEKAEPLGPAHPLEILIIAPCTGNTLAKIANGITDTAVTMAAKAHLRCDRPLLIALASNDAMSQNLQNISKLISHRSVYFLPMKQDAPLKKPHSLVCEFDKIPFALGEIRRGRQLRPLFTV
jgi:dipicolinate synthase subunit B